MATTMPGPSNAVYIHDSGGVRAHDDAQDFDTGSDENMNEPVMEVVTMT